MEAFGICVRGLEPNVHLLVYPSVVTPAECMHIFFCQLGEFYELYDYRVSVASLVEAYKDHITAHFTRLRL